MASAGMAMSGGVRFVIVGCFDRLLTRFLSVLVRQSLIQRFNSVLTQETFDFSDSQPDL